MAKKKTKKEKELAGAGFEPNEKPKTAEEQEKIRLLNLGKVYKKGGEIVGR